MHHIACLRLRFRRAGRVGSCARRRWIESTDKSVEDTSNVANCDKRGYLRAEFRLGCRDLLDGDFVSHLGFFSGFEQNFSLFLKILTVGRVDHCSSI